MLKYRGYTGYVEFDDEADLLNGEVLDTRDVITIQGKTVEELRKAFRESIDDYLEFCAERNEKPEKPFSGRFVERLSSELHHSNRRSVTDSGAGDAYTTSDRKFASGTPQHRN